MNEENKEIIKTEEIVETENNDNTQDVKAILKAVEEITDIAKKAAEKEVKLAPQSNWNTYVTKKLLALGLAIAVLISTILSVGITKATIKPPKHEMNKPRPHMGLEVRDENVLDSEKISIQGVPGDNARDAGFKPGDEIKRFDGEEVRNSKELSDKINEHKSGDSVKTEISRDGEEIEINSILD